MPVTPQGKADAESELLRVVEQHDAKLVVLARYMQVLSNDLCVRLSGRAINIRWLSSRIQGPNRTIRRMCAASS